MALPDDLLEQTQWDTFWISDDVEIVDRPELLYLRCLRDIPMLNTVTRTRGEVADLPRLVAEVALAHRQVCSRWLVRDLPLRPALEQVLEAADYAPSFPTSGYSIAVDAFQDRYGSDCSVRPVSSMTELRDSVRVTEAAFGAPAHATPKELLGYLAECTRNGGRVYRYVAYDPRTGAPLSTGGMTHYPSLRFCLLWAGSTIAEARGRGCYGAVLAARVERARTLGAVRVGLYAHVDTSAPIVRRLGFERHGNMTFWDRPPV
ncbi:MAG: hypothetical protein DRI90_27880 [Deltaproteobacteria bacterium]|nr:MAG: hypothetical protein DRI90_27880 [Deltaproteobacteria bacterium]